MLGKISIEVSEHGYGVACDLRDVNIIGKIELMHSLAVSLNMDEKEIQLFVLSESLGVLKDAESQVKCTTYEQLHSLLKGEQLEDLAK